VFSARQRTAIHWLRKSGEPNGGKLAGVTILEADRTSVAGLAKKCEGDNRKHGYDYDCDDDSYLHGVMAGSDGVRGALSGALVCRAR